jgi:hypothetical protein
MNEGYLDNLSPRQVGERFALLAEDAREYAILFNPGPYAALPRREEEVVSD